MEEVFQNPVQFSRGINLRDLMTSEVEFQIDMDFKKKNLDDKLKPYHDLIPDSDEDDHSDTEDVLKHIEEATDKMMLSSPEYHSFEDLAAKMIDCECQPSGVVKILIIEEGDGPLVPHDAEVTVHYAAYWEKAKTPFDSTLTMNSGAPIRMRLGSGRFLPGLEVGLTTVRGPTARCLLLLQPIAAWGPRGAPPRVRPEPALFVIALYDVRDVRAAARFNDLPTEEQTKFEVTMITVKSLRAEAKELVAKYKYKKAIKYYQQAMSVLSVSRPQTAQEKDELKQIKIKIYVNLAICYYKINKPKYVIAMCENLDRIIDIESHCKALFYYGKACQSLGRSDDALKYYKKALKLEPKNKDIGVLLAELDGKTIKSKVAEKEMWQKAFQCAPAEKENVYAVDEEFQNGVRDMCQDLAGRDDYARFDLPTGLTIDEVSCIKSLSSQFGGLVVQEDGVGKRKKVTIIKKKLL